jgi:hypothetical protein
MEENYLGGKEAVWRAIFQWKYSSEIFYPPLEFWNPLAGNGHSLIKNRALDFRSLNENLTEFYLIMDTSNPGVIVN